ncbi:MAG: Fic family protein [Acutalibacteraceae bacterium]
MNNRAGHYKSNLSGEMAYKSFVPNPLPPVSPIELTEDIVSLLIKANSQLAVLESVATRIPNVELFVSMYVRKEALMSSQIEGTQATLEDVLDPMLDANTNRNVADVVNYIRATEFAIERLKTLPLCNRLIKEIHAVLMAGVRGQEKSPGEFRYSQNWIGGQGSTLKNARYIPPSPEDMVDAMSDLEKYINADDELNALIRAALIHYQFETIHPFLDGNGRVGRLLITLFLMEQKVLTTPALYISYFLKKNRVEYYDRMTEVRTKGNYEQWIKFFLQAIMESAEDATATIDELAALHDVNATVISKMGRAAKNAMLVFNYLESNPIIEIRKTAEALNITFNTVSSAVNRLVDVGILVQTSNNSRNRTFAYESYLKILRKGT